MNTIEIFNQITDILKDCVKNLIAASPREGADFISAKDAITTSHHLSEKEITLQVKAFRKIHLELETAHTLAEELSVRAMEDSVTLEGRRKLIDDIGAVNTAGFHINDIATEALKHLPKDSPQSELIYLAYAEASEVYTKLQVFVRKAKPKGILPPINHLNKLK